MILLCCYQTLTHQLRRRHCSRRDTARAVASRSSTSCLLDYKSFLCSHLFRLRVVSISNQPVLCDRYQILFGQMFEPRPSTFSIFAAIVRVVSSGPLVIRPFCRLLSLLCLVCSVPFSFLLECNPVAEHLQLCILIHTMHRS